MERETLEKIYQLFLQSTGISTDSRSVTEGQLFIALKGESFNGNVYAQKALNNGAIAAVVDEREIELDGKSFLVEDSLACLQSLARLHRSHFEIPIIAITGSNGKTTTKELLACVLSKKYSCHFTQGNFNNHIGVPLTLLRMKKETQVAIIEMGANHQGEIKELCEIAEPTHGIITNIGNAHLEGFGGIEGVKKGKSELYNYLSRNNGVGFINKDEDFLDELSTALRHKRVLYGEFDQMENVKWLRVKLESSISDYLKVSFVDEKNQEWIVDSKLIGKYNLPNIITAISLGLYFKVNGDNIVAALSSYLPSNNRSQVIEKAGLKIILDAYNANPSSMKVAIESFAKSKGTKKKVVILGSMLELGEYAEESHLAIARLAKEKNFASIILVGDFFQKSAASLSLSYFSDVQSLQGADIISSLEKGSLVLIKGSRSIKLEKLLTELD